MNFFLRRGKGRKSRRGLQRLVQEFTLAEARPPLRGESVVSRGVRELGEADAELRTHVGQVAAEDFGFGVVTRGRADATEREVGRAGKSEVLLGKGVQDLECLSLGLVHDLKSKIHFW